eukprot:gene11148-3970_t
MEESYRLWRIRRTAIEMLRDRGYNVLPGDLSMKYEKFKDTFSDNVSGGNISNQKYTTISRERLTTMVEKEDDPSDTIMVMFPTYERIGLKEIKAIHEKMKKSNVKRSILVLQAAQSSNQRVLSSQASRAIDGFKTKGYIIETFKESELLINITQHSLVPEHIPLNDDEKKALTQRYKLKDTQLPRMLSSDPISRYYGLERGKVVKIIRSSETAGRYVTYRIVL